MKSDEKRQRMDQIEKVAFELLAKEGYDKVSMLKIAKHAKASNQTMYSWYGNKQHLFENIIRHNATRSINFLKLSLTYNNTNMIEHTLSEFGIQLLTFITSNEAQIINRAAIIDSTDTGVLARAIDSGVRCELLELLNSFFKKAIDEGQFTSLYNEKKMAETYISLLFGELQFRGALGLVEPLSEKDIITKSHEAAELASSLFKR